MNDYINISSIETHLEEALRSVGQSVYAGTLPGTLKDGAERIVVIDCGNAVSDLNAYGKGIVNIYLYAKPIAQGAKNVPALSKMEKAFGTLIRENRLDSEHYFVSEAYRRADFDSTYGLHFIIIAIHLIAV